MTTDNSRFTEVKITGITETRKHVMALEAQGLSRVVKPEAITRPMVEVITWDKNWNPVVVLVEKF